MTTGTKDFTREQIELTKVLQLLGKMEGEVEAAQQRVAALGEAVLEIARRLSGNAEGSAWLAGDASDALYEAAARELRADEII